MLANVSLSYALRPSCRIPDMAVQGGMLLKRWVAAIRRRLRPTPGAEDPSNQFIYRLRTWPELSDEARTAEVFRVLSVMSSRPVNRNWVLATSGMPPQRVDQFLSELAESGAVEVIDPSGFAPLEAERQPA